MKRNIIKIVSIKLVMATQICCLSVTAQQHIFIASVPKSGTHLLEKAILLILKSTARNIAHCFIALRQIDLDRAREANAVLLSHALCTEHNIALIRKNKFKGFFIYRDPRDMLCSYPYWMQHNPAIWPYYNGLSTHEIIHMLISDYRKHLVSLNNIFPECDCHDNMQNLLTVNDFYRKGYLPWQQVPEVYTTTFEKLVGPTGGGILQEQLVELKNIARHIDIELSDERALEIAGQLFGGTATFRQGQIGAWKQQFTPEHKTLFKSVCGDLLHILGYEAGDW